MGRIAEIAIKIASREAYEYRRHACVRSLPLQGIEYLVNPHPLPPFSAI